MKMKQLPSYRSFFLSSFTNAVLKVPLLLDKNINIINSDWNTFRYLLYYRKFIAVLWTLLALNACHLLLVHAFPNQFQIFCQLQKPKKAIFIRRRQQIMIFTCTLFHNTLWGSLKMTTSFTLIITICIQVNKVQLECFHNILQYTTQRQEGKNTVPCKQ